MYTRGMEASQLDLNDETYACQITEVRLEKSTSHPNKALSIPEPSNKLAKAASFSGLPTKRSISIEQQYQTEKDESLSKRYSCEQIFNRNSNTREIKISEEVKTGNKEHKNVWRSTLPSIPTLYETNLAVNPKKLNLLSSPIIKQRNKCNSIGSVASRSILAPPKFIANFNNSSRSDLQNQEDNKNQSFSEKREVFNKEVLYDIDRLPSPIVPTSQNPFSSTKHKTFQESDALIKQRLEESSILKEKLRSLIGYKVQHTESKSKSKKMNCCWQILFFVLLSITSVFVGAFFSRENILKQICNPTFDFSTLKHSLKNKVYGQPEAVAKLSEELDKLKHSTGTHVIALVGGIGVGKSHIANIIKAHMQETGNVLEYFPPVYVKHIQAYSSLYFCYCNLIILENLKAYDVAGAAAFVQKLNGQASNKHCILILALVNTQETDASLMRSFDMEQSLSMVENAFEEIKLHPVIISFKPMDEDAITKCILDAAEYTNVKLSDEDVIFIKNGLLISDSGCKGAYGKVQLLGTHTTKTLKNQEF